MDLLKIQDIILTPLKIIQGQQGNVQHAMKNGDDGFNGFGEAYFSTVNQGAVKGWKRHREMVLNLVVPVGSIKFVIFDARQNSKTFGLVDEIELSPEHYFRLTVPNGLWVAFQGKGAGLNLLLNMASIKHDPTESDTLPVDSPEIPYNNWLNE